jgi:hypothetical protein
MAFVNITRNTFNPYSKEALNEGQFSWMTYDTDKQIGSEKQNTINVYMYDNEGNQWFEKKYDGYGEFGGMDYYALLAKMNGYSAEDITKKGMEMRDLGIDLAFNKLKTKAKGGKVLFPALVEDPKFNWKRHDFTKEAESDENQSWYQEPDYDEEDDDYENGWYESLKTNEGAMSEIHLMAKEAKDAEDFKKQFYKEYGAKIKKSGETDEWIKELYVDATNESVVTEAKIKITKNEWPYLEFKDGGKTHKVEFDYEDIIDDHGNEGQDQYWLGKDDNGQEWMIDVYASSNGDVEEVHYDTIVKESAVTEATIVMDAMDPGSKILAKLLKKHKVTMEILQNQGPSGWPEVKLTGDRKDLEKVLASEDGWDDADLAEYIEESVVTGSKLTWDSLKESLGINEGRSINKVSKDLEKTVLDMKKTVDEWKEAEGDRKSELLEKLRELNKRKAELEAELNDAVAGKDHDLQLALEEAEELAYLELDVKNIFENEQA